MPIVTGMEALQRDKERVRLVLDDERALELPLMAAARLRRGQALSECDIAELAEAASFQRAFDQALRYLSYRPRSTEEVRRHLVKKRVPESLIAMVTERLRQRGYVDDREFARFWIDSRVRFKPMGYRALRFELRQKGVDDAIIEALLAEVFDEDNALRAAQSRLSRYRGKTRREFRQKLSALLRRRGFAESAISDVVQRLRAELEENDPDYFQPDDAE